MHLGNAFAALGAWLGAHAGGAVDGDGVRAESSAATGEHARARVLLRIEDIDGPRTVKDADRWIMDDFAWLGLEWDGEPVYQSQRTDLYEQVLRGLGEQALGKNEWLTYPCYCTRAQLRAASAPQDSDGFVVYPGTCRPYAEKSSQKSLLQEPGKSRFLPREGRNPAVRLAMPQVSQNRIFVEFCDQIYGKSSWNLPRSIGDIVLRRSDGLFAYQLAVVVDDYLQGVNQVVRGRDLLRSTAAQIWLRGWVAVVLEEMGIEPQPASPSASAPTPLTPEYAHLPLLLSAQKKRLAKRDHSLELSTLRERGVSPERIIGYLAWLMGIIPKPEACTPRELLTEFSWEKIRVAGLTDRQTEPSILAQ